MLRNIICSLLLSLSIEYVSSLTIKRPSIDYICPDVKCSSDCPRGYTYDIHGCNICDCKPLPYPCPRIMCLSRHCYPGGGPLKDRHGCPTCGCSVTCVIRHTGGPENMSDKAGCRHNQVFCKDIHILGP